MGMEEEDELETLVVLKRPVCDRDDVIEFVREEEEVEMPVIVAVGEDVDEGREDDDSCAKEEGIDIKHTMMKYMRI